MHALAVGVEVDRNDVRLRFQLTELTDQDAEDIADIAFELEVLVGSHVQISTSHELRKRRLISPHDRVRWIWLAR